MAELLRKKALQSGMESRVKVNQRMLIDKMLARYSSDFVVCRELIQNADDAKASWFHFEINCHKKNCIETDIQSQPIDEIRAINNGCVFNENDWTRVAAIAEGNTSVESVGQFGVGFFSVFSFSEEPIIASGKEYMAFVWCDDNSLTTYRHELPEEQQSLLTSVILKMRTDYILNTQSDVDFEFLEQTSDDESNKKSRKKKKRSNMDEETVPTIHLNQLKAYFTKVLSFTKHIQQLIIKVNQEIVFKVTKTSKKSSDRKGQFNMNSIHNFFKMTQLTESEQTFSIENGPSIKLNHISVECNVIIDEQYHQQIRRILKKSLPPSIQIQLLYHSDNILKRPPRKSSNSVEALYLRILHSLVPLRDGKPAGLIFIGLGTHQTTGVGMHVYSHLIPTIERENLDLQDPYIFKWNKEILLCVGQVLRVIYEQSMKNTEDYLSLFSNFSFQTSVPNQQIGLIIIDGFFSIDRGITVPVKMCPTDTHLSLVQSNKAYITSSKYLHSFLSLPLIPFEFNSNGFFQSLKERDLINEINDQIIESTIVTSVLLDKQFVALLHWLSTTHRHDKAYVKRVLSLVRFRETNTSDTITLEKLKYYDEFKVPANILLPTNVLPSSITVHLSREELEKQLNLSSWTMKDFVHFYLLKNHQHLFTHESTACSLLCILSKNSGQMTKTDQNKIKTTLSSLTCIPTSQGMKLPNESYIPSSLITSDVPLIKLPLPKNEDEADEDLHVSEEFLRRIGCRTVNVQSFVQSRALVMNESGQRETMKLFIEQLMEEKESMSEGDFNALKRSECLPGTTLRGNETYKKKYAPEQLHFPWLAQQLQWIDLPIIDWVDLDRNSREYNFLKSIGVREVPELNQLIDRIISEYHCRLDSNKIPLSMEYFAENFQQEYSKLWKIVKVKRAFLPSIMPDQSRILSSPDEVFKVHNPLFVTLSPEIVDLFEQNFNISLLGIKDCPTLTVAFDKLMAKRDDILTIESARDIFSYMHDLDGLTRPLIERISKFAFIPVDGTPQFLRPSQVFIRATSNSSTIENINTTKVSSDEDSGSEENITSERIRHRRRGKREAKANPKVSKKSKTTRVSSSTTPVAYDPVGLIDFVDFGPLANSFLLNIGVTHYPSPIVLAELLIDRHREYFSHATGDDLKPKLLAYTSYLRTLAQSVSELQTPALTKRLKNEPWCLGYQTVEDRSQRLFRIVCPNEIFLDDDHQCAIDLRPLLPPEESEITTLYKTFGAKWLTECVTRSLVHKGKKSTSDRGNKLRDLIQYRLDMLFVNNRGEKMDKIEEKHLGMLRSSLSVYEVDAIQCHLTFQKKTIVLDAINSSSCALEHDRNDVYLYFQKNIREFDFIDIASELARFVFKKPLDTVVHAISDKLASPLETLKRRGIPVDRLLQFQNQSSPAISIKSKRDMSTESSEVKSTENLEMTGHISDFSHGLVKDEKKLLSAIRKGRSFTQTKFIQQEHMKDEIEHSCEAVPAANMTRYKDRFHLIPLYVENNVRVTNQMIDHAKQFAWLLVGLAKEVFQIPIETLHLYRDIDGARLAFNDHRSLFFNLRYYEQVFAKDIQPYLKNSAAAFVTRSECHALINFYFLTMCHELAHNLEESHNAAFVNQLETIAVRFLTAKDVFVQKFSFENYTLS